MIIRIFGIFTKFCLLFVIFQKSYCTQVEYVTVGDSGHDSLQPLDNVDDENTSTNDVPRNEILSSVEDMEIETTTRNNVINTGVPSKEDKSPYPPPFLKEPEDDVSYDNLGDIESPIKFDLSGISLAVKRFENSTTGYFAGKASCQCGRPGERAKIVEGKPVQINEYPWTAALLRKSWLGITSSRPYCGGTLINDRYIVTASHCVDRMLPSGIVVTLHEENFQSSTELESSTQKFSVQKIIMHPKYNRRTIDNDIALLKLSKPADLGSVIVPACLPANNDYTFEGIEATAAGWGATCEGCSTSNTLRAVMVPVISNEDCNSKTKYTNKITENMLCAGYIDEGKKDSCQGDSGGPLTIENGGRRTLIGVVSWGYGCARPKSPGVYTRVGRYPDFILANTKDANWCSG